MSEPDKDKNSFLVTFGLYGAVGFQLVISVVAGLFLGEWADKSFKTGPWLMILGIVLGAVVGFYNLVRLLNRKEAS